MPTDVIIRPLTSVEDFEACRALEGETWGHGLHDSMPMPMLIVLTHIGGLVAGAFDGSGELLGFVLSLPGVRDGEVIHWSHLLAVRGSARNLGIGRRLKEYQIAELARRGIAHVCWSYDPLVAKNAHLNLERLGARVVEYVPNFYGVTDSPLHYGVPTDRFVVACPTGGTAAGDSAKHRADDRSRERSPVVRAVLAHASPESHYPVLTPFPRPGDVQPPEDRARMSVALVEVPVDIEALLAREPEAGAVWRAATREHFTWALEHGYDIAGIAGGAPSASQGASPDASPDALPPARAFYICVTSSGGT